MKKVLAVCMTLLSLCGCSKGTSTSKTTEYTITNNVELHSTPADMSGYTLIRGEAASYELVTLNEAMRLFEEGGSGILYLGHPDCEWCKRALPELNEVLKEMNLSCYYVDDTVSITQTDMDKLIKYTGDTLRVDAETREKVFYVPYVCGIKNGEITGAHISLVDDYELSDGDQMSDEQKEELQDIYRGILLKTVD